MSCLSEPSWMGLYRDCCALLLEGGIKAETEISKEKMRKMTSVFQKKHDKIIQQFVEEATIKLNKCEVKVKEMERTASLDYDVTPTERKTFTSVLISTANNIRQQTRKLRSQQQSQLHRQRQMNTSNKKILDIQTEPSQTENWLSQEQFQMMQKDMMRERNEEVTKIVQSIYSLNTIYKEMQSLVIQQGSLLDRIDENIDRTVHSVSEAKKHLQQAKEHQESNCVRKVRRFLVAAIILLVLIFFIKHI